MGERTLIMGVLNVTPDSFYDGGRYFKLNRAIDRGLQMEEEGADILDVGGESTHPRSRAVPAAEEIKRVVPVIEALRHRLTIPISVDTYKSAVARPAIAAGAEIVNDVGGLRLDPDLAHLVSASNAAVILMHSRGTRDSMHSLPRAQNILRVVMEGLSRSVQKAISSGIGPNRIIVDPGLGFGKHAEDNLILLKKLERFGKLHFPLLVGASRKSFLGKILDLPVGERLFGSFAGVAIAILKGAHIVRVHDVKETLQVARVCDAVMNSSR